MDMQGLPAATEAGGAQAVRGRRLCMGWIRERGHAQVPSGQLSLCAGDSVQKRTRVTGHSGPPGGPDHPPRPLTQERKLAHPPACLFAPSLKWMLPFSPSP